MDRLAERGTTFDRACHGSTPCIPARRDIYTGRYEFLERGWGPLEENDRDLPREVSGDPNSAIAGLKSNGMSVSQLITDHYHPWEQDSGQLPLRLHRVRARLRPRIRQLVHRADRVRLAQGTGIAAPAALAQPRVRQRRPADDRRRARRRVGPLRGAGVRRGRRLDRSQPRPRGLHLHVDCFDPHEPFGPPEYLLKEFDPRGYDIRVVGFAARLRRIGRSLHRGRVPAHPGALRRDGCPRGPLVRAAP